MRTVRSALIALAGVSVVALTGCMPIAAGPQTSETRDITAVTTVVLDTSGDITISEGEPSLVIHATEDALKRLTSTVAGDTLTLGNKPGLGLDLGKISYDITLPDLEAIELNGSGDIEATVSSPGAIRLEVDGSGDVHWTGLSSDSVEVQLPGSGRCSSSTAAPSPPGLRRRRRLRERPARMRPDIPDARAGSTSSGAGTGSRSGAALWVPVPPPPTPRFRTRSTRSDGCRGSRRRTTSLRGR